MLDKISTKDDRAKWATTLLNTLLGNYKVAGKRPLTLTKGINYTPKEWGVFNEVEWRLRNNDSVSIIQIFELEEIEQKYSHYLMLAKLEQ